MFHEIISLIGVPVIAFLICSFVLSLAMACVMVTVFCVEENRRRNIAIQHAVHRYEVESEQLKKPEQYRRETGEDYDPSDWWKDCDK